MPRRTEARFTANGSFPLADKSRIRQGEGKGGLKEGAASWDRTSWGKALSHNNQGPQGPQGTQRPPSNPPQAPNWNSKLYHPSGSPDASSAGGGPPPQKKGSGGFVGPQGPSVYCPEGPHKRKSFDIVLSPSSSSDAGNSEEDEAPTKAGRVILRAHRKREAKLRASGALEVLEEKPELFSAAAATALAAAEAAKEQGEAGKTSDDPFCFFSAAAAQTALAAATEAELDEEEKEEKERGPQKEGAFLTESVRVPSRYARHKMHSDSWLGGKVIAPNRPQPLFGVFEGGKEEKGFITRPVMQFLFFIRPLKEALLSHTCSGPLCVACEVGSVMHSLELARY